MESLSNIDLKRKTRATQRIIRIMAQHSPNRLRPTPVEDAIAKASTALETTTFDVDEASGLDRQELVDRLDTQVPQKRFVRDPFEQ